MRSYRSFLLACFALSFGILPTLAQPVFDTSPLAKHQPGIVSLLAAGDVQDLGSFEVDTQNREETRAFYNAIFMASEGVEIGWTGDYFNLSDFTAAAGDTSEAYKLATLLRINYFRAMAGLPADIVFHGDMNADCQLAALIMSGNDSLSHDPADDSFPNYMTTAGDVTAGKSNIAIGSSGPDAIVGYMRDKGDNNYKVGHRRWILYPPSFKMGSGDAPGGTAPDSVIGSIETFTGSRPNNDKLRSANSLQVITDFNSTRPTTAWPYVAYPAPGYVPYQVVYPRWSFSLQNANFTAATVTMTRNGSPVNVQLEALASNIGDSTLAWIYDNQDANANISHSKPDSDTSYEITVSGIANAPQNSYTYTVTVIDPATAGSDTLPTSISGFIDPLINAENAYTVQFPGDWVTQKKWRVFSLVEEDTTWDAEDGSQDATFETTAGYDVAQTAVVDAGARSYQLIPFEFEDQFVELTPTFAAKANSTLSFRSRLRAMTEEQLAEVHISLDGGTSWNAIDSQIGIDQPGESGFSLRTINLSAYAGKTFQIRFALILKESRAYIPTDSSNNPFVGWFFDEITFANVNRATGISVSDTESGSAFSFTPSATSEIVLQAQAVIFDDYALEWGPYLTVNPVVTRNSAPVAVDDTASITEGQVSVLGNVLNNDTDADANTTLTVSSVAGNVSNVAQSIDTTYGSISIQADGSFTFRLDNENTAVEALNNGETLQDIIAYSVSDGEDVDSGSLTVTIAGQTLVVVESQLENIATQARVQANDGLAIGGFVIAGNDDLEVLVLGISSELLANSNLNSNDMLDDPILTIYNSQNQAVATNDNWESDNSTAKSTAIDRLGATELQANSNSAALLETLSPGVYTVFLQGVATSDGIGLIEIYQASTPNSIDSELVNISTRGYAGTGSDVMVSGFVIHGDTDKHVLIQGVASELANGLGQQGRLADPIIKLYDSEDNEIETSDDWDSAEKAAKVAAQTKLGATLLADGSASAALYQELAPGAYTVEITGANGSTGIALIEVYLDHDL